MFNLSSIMGSGLSGFMGGMSGLGWTPPSVPTPAFGDTFNLNNLYMSTLGPSGLMGTGGAPYSLAAGFSGAIGGDMANYINAKIPVYGVVTEKTPIYTCQNYCFDNRGDGECKPVFLCDADGDGTINTNDLIKEDPGDCENKYKNGWETIERRLGQGGTKITDREQLDRIKVWYDDNHDGQVGDNELRKTADLGIQSIDTCNGTIQRKSLLGYQCTPHQAVTGYYNFNTYSSNTGIDNQSFTYEPVTAGSALQQALAGNGSFASLPGVGNYYGQPNSWGTTGINGGNGWQYGWNGSGWGNGYVA